MDPKFVSHTDEECMSQDCQRCRARNSVLDVTVLDSSIERIFRNKLYNLNHEVKK